MSDSNNDAYRIEVFAESEYLPEQSDADQKRWAFAYHIRIINRGVVDAEKQLREG